MTATYIEGSDKKILQEMQRAGFNVMTCGNCGNIKLAHTGIEEATCEGCGFTSDPCDFPDLYTVEA